MHVTGQAGSHAPHRMQSLVILYAMLHLQYVVSLNGNGWKYTYDSTMALVGQMPTQAPQEIQSASLIT